MNQRRARLIRKYVSATSPPHAFKKECRRIKREYNRAPKDVRKSMREQME